MGSALQGEDGTGGRTTGREDESLSVAEAAELSPTELAKELLVACKRGDDPRPYEAALADIDDADLRPLREDQATGLAFWLNCYNAGAQLLLERRPHFYESALRQVLFFNEPVITVSGSSLGLDRIENGILRRGHSKYGFGYTPKWFVTSFEYRHRVQEVDPRIHFALNCGAASCPAIRAYDPEDIDSQLDLATRVYLDETIRYDAEADIVRVPRVFLWFHGDFGGGPGTREFLREHGAVPPNSSPNISYLEWDWSKDAEDYARKFSP